MKSVQEFNGHIVSTFIESILKNAAESFSKIAGMNIQSRPVQVTLSSETHVTVSTAKRNADLCVLITPLLGELPGRSYLILDTAEVEVLLQNSPFKPSSGFDSALREALLKEIDNIVSASVITELANKFHVDVYGDVPELVMLSATEISEQVRSYIPNGQLSLLCSGGFISSENETFAPQFIWKFSSAIVNRIETYTK